MVFFPNGFDDINGRFGLTETNKNNVTFEEKEFLVRFISTIHDMEIEVMESLNQDIKYYFNEPGYTSTNSYTR